MTKSARLFSPAMQISHYYQNIASIAELNSCGHFISDQEGSSSWQAVSTVSGHFSPVQVCINLITRQWYHFLYVLHNFFPFLGYCLGTRRWRISHLSQFRSNYQNSCALEKAWIQGMNMFKNNDHI